jgi:hypothetical protein
MGGFAGIPTQRDLEDFVVATMNVAESQFLYSLHQLEHRKWDLFFHTNLTVDRIQHYAWRHFDENDPTYAGNKLSQLIPLAHQQVDRFLGSVRALLDPEDQLVVLSDHGHGQRSSIGVNLAEIFRRQGLLVFDRTSRVKRVIERTKTSVISAAYACHIEEPMTWVARRLPGKQSLKSGAFAGDQNNSMVTIPDVGGSNPFGGIQVGDPALIDDVLSVVNELEHDGKKVFRWCLPAEEILSTKSNPFEFYPTLLFELEPSFGPTWNMFGREFTPIMTHKIQSGGHTRRAVFCSTDASIIPPTDSLDVNRALIQLMDKYV